MYSIHYIIYIYVYIHTGRQKNSKTPCKRPATEILLIFLFDLLSGSPDTDIQDKHKMKASTEDVFCSKNAMALFRLGRLVWFDDFLQAQRSRGSQTNFSTAMKGCKAS